MGLIVQKFGGTSVADRICLYNVANMIARRIKEGHQVITVVSAQGDSTDLLVNKAAELAEKPNLRELDALLSVGEQITASLLAVVLNELGVLAVSLNGGQAGIYTDDNFGDAAILRIDTERIKTYLSKGYAVVVTGFQGCDNNGNITTLGRGGSDTTAVALAAFLDADECRIYKDVDGIYTADPRVDPNAKKLKHLSYDEMLALCRKGCGVLQQRSVELAKEYGVILNILSSFHRLEGTMISD